METTHYYDVNKALIELVRKYPLLYDVKHNYYRHSKHRHHAWNEVARILKSTNKDVRSRWKWLRDHWKRQKQLNLSKNGATSSKNFKYFDEMAFADEENFSQGSEMKSYLSEDANLLISSVCSTVYERSTDQDAINGYCNFVANNMSPDPHTEIEPKIEQVDLTIEDIDDQQPDSRASVDHTVEEPQQQMHIQSPPWPRKEQNSVINSTSADIDDEYLIAGRRIGYQLKSVDEFQRTIAEKLISDIVYNAKMGNLSENSTITLDVTEANSRKPIPMQF